MTGKPLVIRFGALGDMVLCTPLMKALYEKLGHPCDLVLKGKHNKLLFRNLPFVRDMFALDSRKTPYMFSKEQKELVSWLEQREHTHVYLLEDDDKSEFLLKKAGVVNYPSVRTVPREINEHVVYHHARIGGFNPDECRVIYPELKIDDDEKKELKQWLEGFGCFGKDIVLIQFGNRKTMTGSSRILESKHWPAGHWSEVIKSVLLKKPEARVLITGSDKEQEAAAELRDLSGDQRVFAVADQLPLRRFLALIHHAHSMISVDTGPAHAAAALQCNLVVLFGKTDPRVNMPISSKSRVLVVTGPATRDRFDGKEMWAKTHSMQSITVPMVINSWEKFV